MHYLKELEHLQKKIIFSFLNLLFANSPNWYEKRKNIHVQQFPIFLPNNQKLWTQSASLIPGAGVADEEAHARLLDLGGERNVGIVSLSPC